ncbi:MAG: hypothetical protein RBT16_14480, partial [Desulfococcus multivorans]|nr:hypothetical protein [Desulfococcus multivorans]
MKKRIGTIGMIALAAVICMGCAQFYSTPLEENWGQAYHSTLQSQKVYPQKPAPTASVEGHDGVAAATAKAKYRDSFKKA